MKIISLSSLSFFILTTEGLSYYIHDISKKSPLSHLFIGGTADIPGSAPTPDQVYDASGGRDCEGGGRHHYPSRQRPILASHHIRYK